MKITQFETRIEHAAVTYHVQMIATKKKCLSFLRIFEIQCKCKQVLSSHRTFSYLYNSPMTRLLVPSKGLRGPSVPLPIGKCVRLIISGTLPVKEIYSKVVASVAVGSETLPERVAMTRWTSGTQQCLVIVFDRPE